jgi:hypothetical protein
MNLKNINEIMIMINKIVETKDCADIVNYINFLHNKIKNYQMVVDFVELHNEHINENK